MYIHCLDGRRLTSLVVLILRKLQLYSVQWSFSEYWRYQCHGRTPFPIQDIERASKDIEKYMSSLDTSELVIPLKGIPSWLAGGNRARFAAIYSKSIGGGGGSSSSLKTIHNSGNLGSGKVSQVVLASTSSSDFLPANILAAQSLLSFPNNEAAVNTSSTPRILTSGMSILSTYSLCCSFLCFILLYVVDSKVITGLALHGMDLPIRATRKKSSGHIKIPKPL